MTTISEDYSKLDALGYNQSSIDDLGVILTSSIWDEGEPTYSNIGTFDAIKDQTEPIVRNETKTANTLSIVPLLASLQLNAGRENTHLGVYMFDNVLANLQIITQQILDRGGGVYYSATRRYGIYIDVVDKTTGVCYVSQKNENLGNALTDNTSWYVDSSKINWNDWTVGGTENAITFTNNSPFHFLQSFLKDGVTIPFVPKYNNTSATTIEVEGTTYQILNEDGSVLTANNLVAGNKAEIYFVENANVFFLRRKIFDNTHFLYSTSENGNTITLTSNGGLKLTSSWLYDKMCITLYTNISNTGNVRLIIDDVTYPLLTTDNTELKYGELPVGMSIIYYDLVRNVFKIKIAPVITFKAIGSIIPMFRGDSGIKGVVPCNGGTYNVADYPDYWNLYGSSQRSNGIRNGCAWTGGGYIYRDIEYPIDGTNNNIFSQQTPSSIGNIIGQTNYAILLDNNILYTRNDFTQQVYSNNGTQVYLNKNTVSVGDIVYDNPTPTTSDNITDIVVSSISIVGLTYSVSPTNNRMFQNSLDTYWVLSSFKNDYSTGKSCVAFLSSDDIEGHIVGTLSSGVVDDKIVLNGFTYAKLGTSQGYIRWDWDGIQVDGNNPTITSIFTLGLVNPVVGDNIYDSIVPYSPIDAVDVSGIVINNGATNYDTYMEVALGIYQNADLQYRYTDSPIIGAQCYPTPIPVSIGRVVNIEDTYESSLGILLPTEDANIYQISGTNIFLDPQRVGNITTWKIYLTQYPTRIGQYTAYTDTTITYDGNVCQLDNATIGRYIATGTVYYSSCPKNPAVLFFSNTDENNTLQVLSIIDENTINTEQGIVHRYKAGDDTTFTVPDLNSQNRPLIGTNTQSLLGTITNGQIPNLTGTFGLVSADVFRASGVFYDAGTSETVSTYGSANGHYVGMDARRKSNVYAEGVTQVIPSGFMCKWYIVLEG